MKAVRVWVSGVVQGVGFRAWTQALARRTGVKGWVRNRRDGRVEAWFEGDEAAVAAALAEVKVGGPPSARVDGVDVQEGAPQGATDFLFMATE